MAAVTARKPQARRQTVLSFDEGSSAHRSALVRGGKGANLAEMVALGLPIPAGFTLTTTVARAFTATGRLPRRLVGQFNRGIQSLERQTGKEFGNPENPLLVSVRSGAPASMPGMMDTVLNVGLNPATVQGLARLSGEWFAWDTYRRFLALFGQVVMLVPGESFAKIVASTKMTSGVREDHELSTLELVHICNLQRALIEKVAGRPVPDDPFDQLSEAIVAVLSSWMSERAAAYRTTHNLPDWWGTAVTVQSMVFGNHGDDSGTGVVFSHNVVTGQPGLYGEFLPNAQGEDVVSGVRTPRPVAEMAEWAPVVYRELESHVSMLADHFGDIVDVEFTVQEGRLYLLQVRRAKRTPLAAVTFAVHQVWAKKWTHAEAVARVASKAIAQLQSPAFEAQALKLAAHERLLATGLAASPGSVTGAIALSSAQAQKMAKAGHRVVLATQDTSPNDLPGMLVSAAIITVTGGATCHAAVVARELGLPAVVGSRDLDLSSLQEGEVVSVDGATGMIIRGEVPRVVQDSTKEVNIFLRWVARNAHYEPRVGFEWTMKSLSANALLNDFYLADAMMEAATGSELEASAKQLRNQLHRNAAECLVAYLAIAVAGELRHRYCDSTAVDQKLAQLGIGHGGDRHGIQMTTLQTLKTGGLEAQIEFFQLAVKVFNGGRWGSGYGGSAWGKIAQAPVDFLTGKLSPSVFVDHVFDLRHNGGRLFDKHPMVSSKSNDSTIVRQLEAKKHASTLAELYRTLTGHYDQLGPEVAAMWLQGKTIGLW